MKTKTLTEFDKAALVAAQAKRDRKNAKRLALAARSSEQSAQS